jgi:hypothetical protein
VSLEAERQRGEEARRLLAHPLLAEAFAAIDADLRRRWEASGDGESAARERLWLALRLLGRLRGALAEVLETGRLAAVQLDEMAAQRAKEMER